MQATRARPRAPVRIAVMLSKRTMSDPTAGAAGPLHNVQMIAIAPAPATSAGDIEGDVIEEDEPPSSETAPSLSAPAPAFKKGDIVTVMVAGKWDNRKPATVTASNLDGTFDVHFGDHFRGYDLNSKPASELKLHIGPPPPRRSAAGTCPLRRV